MKRILFTLAVLVLLIASCNSTKSTVIKSNTLEGTWVLNYISGPRIAFEGLYPNIKPTIAFDLKENKISGNNSCNQYFGALEVDKNSINFKDAKMGMSMMACQGSGDVTYMKTLEKIDSYTVSEDGKTLNFSSGDVVMMRFNRQD